MSLGEAVVAAVSPHPAVRRIELVGSRAEGRATQWSDWDFAVETSDFPSVASALPGLLEPLEPLAQQWDRLSAEQCWMLILAGPVKVDLIFGGEPHAPEGPWEVRADTLAGIDAHFWDWMLWLRAKERTGKSELVDAELEKLLGHLLGPLGVARAPSSVAEAVETYREVRDQSEARLDTFVSRSLEEEVAPALAAG